MKRILLIVLICLQLCGCRGEPVAHRPAEPSPSETVTTVPETTAPQTTEPEETEPENSALYLPDVPVEDVITWFTEMCLSTEFLNYGDPSVVQKWETPILYMIHGEATPEDLAVLEDFSAWLNTVPGFPGIRQSQDRYDANMHIYFVDQEALINAMGADFTGMDGALTFLYDGFNAIYSCDIYIRTDLNQQLRNSVVLEEVYNGLGPIQDTVLRPDSICYQEFSEPQSLTKADELILQLLYHPDIRCGMDAAQCEAVIRTLYY